MKKLLHFVLFLSTAYLVVGQTTEVMADWETVNLEMNGSFGNGYFADSLFSIVANPNPSGINTSDNVQIWKKATDAVTWGGFYYDLPEPVDLTGQIGQICVDVHADETINFRLKIEQSQDGGPDASFDMDYTTPGEWQQICFDLYGEDTEGGIGITRGYTYNRLTLFPNFGAVPAEEASYYMDNIEKTTGTPGVEENVIADWETVNLDMVGSFGNGYFADSLFSIVANPNPSGINTSANVQLWKKATDAATWGGFYYDLPEAIDLTGTVGRICVDVHAEDTINFRLKIEQSQDGGPDASYDMEYNAPGEWQQICYDLFGEDVDGNIGHTRGFTYNRLTLFPNFGSVPAEEATYYVDNIKKWTGGLDEDTELISDYEVDGVTAPMLGSFGNGHYADSLFPVVDNPSPDDVNASALVQQWCKANDAQTWGGFFMDVDTIDFTGTKATICVSMYAGEAQNLQAKLEQSATGPDLNIELEYTTPGAWQELCFDFTQPDINGNVGLGHLYHRITLFPDFGVVPAADNCYYLDDIYKITNGGGATLQLLGQVIEGSPDHTMLASLLSTADLWSEVNLSGVTVFAPTDDAFNALPAAVLDALMNNTDNMLYNALLHHVVRDSLPASLLTQDLHVPSRNGQDIIVTEAGARVANANVTTADVMGINGILHVVDAVLEFPEDPDFYTLVDYGDPEYSAAATYFNTNSPDGIFHLVANPDNSGINPNDSVGEFIKFPTGQWFQGLYYDLERPLNLIGDMTELCIKVYFSQAGPIRAKLEQSTTGGEIATIERDVTAANEWQEVCFDLTEESLQGTFAEGHIYNRLTLFFNVVDGVVPDVEEPHLWDQIVVKNTTVGTEEIDLLENFRFYPNPATNWVNIESDTPIHRMLVFDNTGRQLMSVLNPVENDLDVSGLHSGMYFAHFMDASGGSLGTVRFVKH